MISTLLVDDDRAFSTLAAAALKREGFPTTVAHSLHEARRALERSTPELVILDRRLPDGDGIQFLPELKGQSPSMLVVMVTAHGDIASAVEAIRAGALDYLAKPVELSDLVAKARRAAEDLRLRDRLQRVEAELSGRRRLIPLPSAEMKAVFQMLDRIASTPRSPVLLLGETGVGKEVLAWHVHQKSAGSAAPFVQVNCAALPEATAESELFGHERGAFTDAKAAHRGLVEAAASGTLFLDELGELSPALQGKLLTFLDSGAFRRLGGTTEQTSSARVIAATNRDLEGAVQRKEFRQDLWFRLSVFKIHVPPLRDRPKDVVPLAEGLLDSLRTELGKRGAFLGTTARERLLQYSFPGNVRELRNVLERALVLEPGPELRLDLLELWPGAAGASAPGEFRVSGPFLAMEELEKRYARYVLAQLGGKRVEAARALGLSYPTFLKRIEE